MRQVADLFARPLHLAPDVEAADRGVAIVQLERAAEQPHHRRLAGAVRSDQPVDLPRRHTQAHAGDSVRLAEGFVQVVGVDQKVRHSCF